MGKRSTVYKLPPKVREQLEQILIESNFTGYTELRDWCLEQGFEISRSALNRFGQDFEAQVSAIKLSTDQARAIVAASPDDDNTVNDALIRLVQKDLFELLIELTPGERGKLNLPKIAKAIADLGRASVQQKKYAAEVRKRAQVAAEEIGKVATRGGLTDETVDLIKRRILQIGN